jgi:L-aminopeptidase/D-esterase-like protein
MPSANILSARDLGIPFDGTPGPNNAITDVAGVEVGHSTIIRGRGKLREGRGPVRTGVTAILPRGRADFSPAFAGYFSLNGNGEMTGTAWIEESGQLTSPVMITNTHSVGVVRDAVIAWQVRSRAIAQPWALPVVAETWDGYLNDLNGFHVKPRHAIAAIRTARGGRVAQGCVGGGTGMVGYGWKGGIGTSSRKIPARDGGWTAGVIVQLNCGLPRQLVIAGVPVGKMIQPSVGPFAATERGSIIIVAATDAPLLPHQLKRVARRLTIGLARTGSNSGNFSGDLFVAFSTAKIPAPDRRGVAGVRFVANERVDPIFDAVIEATEEAIVNAMVAARTMEGIDGRVVEAIPRDLLSELFRGK